MSMAFGAIVVVDLIVVFMKGAAPRALRVVGAVAFARFSAFIALRDAHILAEM